MEFPKHCKCKSRSWTIVGAREETVVEQLHPIKPVSAPTKPDFHFMDAVCVKDVHLPVIPGVWAGITMVAEMQSEVAAGSC